MKTQNTSYFLGSPEDSMMITGFDDSEMDQVTAAYRSINDTTNSSIKNPFMTDILQPLDISNTSMNYGSKPYLISGYDKKVGFAKEEMKLQSILTKLPSINGDNFVRQRHQSMIQMPTRPELQQSFKFQKQETYLETQEDNLISEYSIDQDQYLQNEQQINLLSNEQKQKFLPIIKEEVGSEKNKFFSQYKNLNKINQYDKRYRSNKYQFKSMFLKAEDCNLLPKTFKIFNGNHDINKELNLNNYGIGNSYCKVFSEALQVEDLSHLKKLKISQNNLLGGSLNKIFKSCTPKVKVLDVSGNQVRQEALATFKPLFARTQLVVLNIQQCKIGDTGFNELYSNIKENHHLKVLNLSMNNLTEVSAQKIKKILLYNTSLFELYLHWNSLKNEGGLEILQGVYENNYLKVLDLSYNSLKYLGELNEQTQQKTSAYQLSQIFSKDNSDLLHLDLSYNNFSQKECKLIKESLGNNNWLYGLHFEGNSNFVVDSVGNIVELAKGFRPRMQHKRQIKSIKQYPFFKEDELWDADQNQLQDICWICQGWQEVQIIAKDIQEEPLFIHLSFTDFKPELLQKNEDGEYIKSVMIPKNKQIHFFFSNPLQSSKGLITSYHESQKIVITQNYKYTFDKNSEKEYPLIVQHQNIIQSDNFNWFEVANHYKVKTKCCPREQSLTYFLPQTDWDVTKSIWKDYKGDTEELLKKCLDYDLICSRIVKFVKDPDDLSKLKDVIIDKYQICKDVYKTLAAIQPQGDTFCIGSNTFLRLIQKTKTLDGGKIKLSDIDRLFIATNFNQEQNELVIDNNPSKALVRYEFIEMLVRLAHEKYPNLKYSEAFSFYYENDLKEHFSSYKICQDWRDKLYWSKEIEHEIISEMKMIKPIYESLIAKNPACYQSSVKYVDLLTFVEFMTSKISHLHPITTNIEIELRQAFLLSLQCNIDELNSTAHKQMGLLEFIEAIVRISDNLFSEEQNTPLNIKLQKMLFEIYGEDEKQEILTRQEFERVKKIQEEQKEIKRIVLRTRKDYEFKPSVSQNALQKYSKVKLLSHQSRFLPSLFKDHQHDNNDAHIYSSNQIEILQKYSK